MVNGDDERARGSLCQKRSILKRGTWSRISPVMATATSFILAMIRSALCAAKNRGAWRHSAKPKKHPQFLDADKFNWAEKLRFAIGRSLRRKDGSVDEVNGPRAASPVARRPRRLFKS